MAEAFEGNTAKTATVIPTITAGGLMRIFYRRCSVAAGMS